MQFQFIKNLCLLSVFCITVQGFQAYGQDPYLDSLRLAETAGDSIRILNELAWNARSSSPDTAYWYASMANDLAKASDDLPGRSTSLVRMANIHERRREFDQGIALLKESLSIESSLADHKGMGRASAYLCTVYREKGQYDSSIHYGRRSLSYYKKLNDLARLAKSHGRLALSYQKRGDSEEAIGHYLKSIELKETIKDSLGTAIGYSNLAAFYIDLAGYRQVIIYANEALEYSKALGLLSREATALTNRAVALEKLGQLNEAIADHQRSIEIKEQAGSGARAAINYMNLGNLYYGLKDYEQSKDYYLKSLALKEQYGNSHNLQRPLLNLGRVYQATGSNEEAILCYQKALKLARESGSRLVLQQLYSSLGQLYALTESYEEAYTYNTLAQTLRDSLESSFKETVDIKSAYENERREKEILAKDKEIQEAQISRQQTTIILLVICGFLIIAALVAWFRAYVNKQRSIKAQHEKEKKDMEFRETLKDQELKVYNAMLTGQEKERHRIAEDLHDEVGSKLTFLQFRLSSMEEQLGEENASAMEVTRVREVLDETFTSIRKVSHNLASGQLSKFGLVPALNNLKKMVAESNEVAVELVVSGLHQRLDLRIEMEIYRTIQELVTNAMKHSQCTELSIQLLRKEQEISILVEDDGIGFDAKAPDFEMGLGLRNIESRIEKMDGFIEFDAYPGRGTTANIKIPLKIEKYDEDIVSG